MKKYLVTIFVILLALSLFSCSASPTAIKVGNTRVDASEYAYYLNYNRLNLDMLSSGSTVLNADELLSQAHDQAVEHIVTAQLVRIKCDELGLELTKEQKEELALEKEELIQSFGGLSGYLDYLRSNALTDRLYDKLQENSYYYSMLYEYISGADGAVTTDQELRQFYTENYLRVRYIRLSIMTEEGDAMEPEQLEQVLADGEDILARIKSGELTFEDAMAQYNDDEYMADNPSGFTIGSQDPSTQEYTADVFSMYEGQVAGVYAYSDGYYILQRLAPEISFFEANREEIEVAASDWAFNNYMKAAREATAVSENGVCKKINFSNLMDYVK